MSKPMSKRALKALKGSIKKWEDIVAGTGFDEGVDNCPLCALYYARQKLYGHCVRSCPVMAKTGRQGCGGTPYEDYNELFTPEQRCEATQATDPATKYQAQRMLDFLKDLLPEGETP